MPPLYGPPVDPREIAVASGFSQAPGAWASSLALGLLFLGLGLGLARSAPNRGSWRENVGAALIMAGTTLLLTAPAGGMLRTAVWGHYPTIDKAGSLHFYALGAHFSAFDAQAASTKLIGVSMGHLWFTQALQWASGGMLPAFSAMNLQALFNLAFSAWVCSRIFRELGATLPASLMAAWPIGLGLHQLRDINWYTIEKCGTGWLFLFFWMLLLANRRAMGFVFAAAGAFAWAFFYNSYWGVVGAMGAALLLPILERPGRTAVALSALASLPLVLVQLPNLANESLPPAVAFSVRAALDVVALSGWNRIEWWAALDIASWVAASWGLIHGARAALRALLPFKLSFSTQNLRALSWFAIVLVPLLLSLGPSTPIWGLFTELPGMWRFAKPETFFHLCILLVGCGAAAAYSRLSPRGIVLIVLVQLGMWLVLVRTHAVYPGFAAPG